MSSNKRYRHPRINYVPRPLSIRRSAVSARGVDLLASALLLCKGLLQGIFGRTLVIRGCGLLHGKR